MAVGIGSDTGWYPGCAVGLSIAVSGVNSDGRMTTVHPAARAAAAARATLYAGKFHAVMMPTTPIGCFRTVRRRVAIRDGTTRP